MSAIGTLLPVQRDGAQALQGHITTLTLDCTLLLLPTGEPSGNNRPAYRVHAEKAADLLVEIGAAWLKRRKDGSGEPFLTVTLDDPSFDKAINVAAFPIEKGGYQISWRRHTDKDTRQAG